MITAGSGLGGFCAIVNQPIYGAAFVNPTRTLQGFKSMKPTFDPHYVQGGPYLSGGRAVDIGSAHVKMYLDAKATLQSDFMTSGMALLLATAMGSGATLKKLGTSAAFELQEGTVKGCKLGIPESHNEKTENGCCVDIQYGVPYTNAEVNAYNLHSCMVQKAEFTFDRVNLVSLSVDFDAQYVETTTGLITPTYSTSSVPYAMNSGGSEFKVGGSPLPGIRKMVVTLEKKLATDRIYLGNEFKSCPVTNGLVDITCSVEADFTSNIKAVFEAFLTNAAQNIELQAEGPTIGSGLSNLFTFKMPNVFINSGAEPPLDGPDLVKNTMTAKATINAANEPAVSTTLITADTTF